MNHRPKRTSSEVLSLVREVSLSLARGETVKTTAARLEVPYNTMTGMLKRHRQRNRQGSIFQMVAEFVREDERNHNDSR